MDNIAELDGIASRISKNVANRIDAELQREFEQGADPYGKQWARLSPATIAKKGHDLILIDTGRTQQQTHARTQSGGGIELVTSDVAVYHQFGNPPRMPAREILPDRPDLPLTWQQIIQEEFEATFRRSMGK